MKVTGLELLFLEVNNLEDSLLFYSDELGFEIESDNSTHEPPMATVVAGNLKIKLAQNLNTMVTRGRGAHFFIGVDDVDTYYQQLRERGVVVNSPIDEGWGGRFITLRDPDKYRFFFVTWGKADDSSS